MITWNVRATAISRFSIHVHKFVCSTAEYTVKHKHNTFLRSQLIWSLLQPTFKIYF